MVLVRYCIPVRIRKGIQERSGITQILNKSKQGTWNEL